MPEGRVAVVFNGEIYNFRALRDELRAPRLDVSHGGRHRDDPRRLARVGRPRGRAPARHVRVRALGRGDRHVLRGPRPPGREAAALRVGRRDARVRLGTEGGARASRGPRRDRPGRAQALSRVPVHPGAALRVPRGAQAAARAYDQARRAHAHHRAVLAAGLHRQARPVRRGSGGRAGPRAARLRRIDAGRRRAARRVRERRHRLRASSRR